MTGHVKFVENSQDKVHDGEIKVETLGETRVRCIIGFLQCMHKYDMVINVPLKLENAVQEASPVPNNFAIVLLESKLNGRVNGTLEDELVINCGGVQHTVVIRANVLGLEEGTPYLKTGIKMIESLPISESDAD